MDFSLIDSHLLILFSVYYCCLDWIVTLANSSYEALTSNEMVFGDEAFGKKSSLDETVKVKPFGGIYAL